ncbi:uncharacterized protein LOC107046635, partial [Diachasma alloeum]|uniref:uncharacterized protein LOC107046635 n=1 Tax=Diachasma alloeum TaxID=454923 RepID=UPI0007381815
AFGGNETFAASKGWLRAWRERYGIRGVKISGEKLSANAAAVDPFKEKFLDIIKKENLIVDQVFNEGQQNRSGGTEDDVDGEKEDERAGAEEGKADDDEYNGNVARESPCAPGKRRDSGVELCCKEGVYDLENNNLPEDPLKMMTAKTRKHEAFRCLTYAGEKGSGSDRLDDLENKINELRNENERLKNAVSRFEEREADYEEKLEQKLHEIVQLSSENELVRQDAARQVARTKERCETIRRTMQDQITDMEKQLAQCRAIAKAAQKDRDEGYRPQDKYTISAITIEEEEGNNSR